MRDPLKNAFTEIHEDEYSEAVEARALGDLLIGQVPTHQPLAAAKIGYLFRDEEISRGGKVELATAQLARFQGAALRRWGRLIEWTLFRVFGFEPDFVILIDRNIWAGFDPEEKLALVDHELLHLCQAVDEFGMPRFNRETGTPVWAIRPHDSEVFHEEIERHGLWKADLVDLGRAVIDNLAAHATDA